MEVISFQAGDLYRLIGKGESTRSFHRDGQNRMDRKDLCVLKPGAIIMCLSQFRFLATENEQPVEIIVFFNDHAFIKRVEE